MTLWAFLLLLLLGVFTGGIGAIIGSSLLVVVPALIFYGLPAHVALGTAKLSTFFRDIPALVNYHREEQVEYRDAIVFTVVGILGAVAGTCFALSLSEEKIELIISLCMIIIGILVMKNPGVGLETRVITRDKQHYLVSVVLGVVIGFYYGIFGGGTNIFAILFFVMVCGHAFLKAIATSKIPILVIGIASILVFAVEDKVDYITVIPLIIGMLVGGHFGSKLAIKKGNVFIRILFLAVVFVMAGMLLFF